MPNAATHVVRIDDKSVENSRLLGKSDEDTFRLPRFSCLAESLTTKMGSAMLDRGGLSRPPLLAPDSSFLLVNALCALTRMVLEDLLQTAGVPARLYRVSPGEGSLLCQQTSNQQQKVESAVAESGLHSSAPYKFSPLGGG